ncbi:unnamed protein product [Rhodiola kirilowii]
MKRKRGNKKGKGKKPRAADLKEGIEIVTVEDSAVGEEGNVGDSNSVMEVDTPESAATDPAEKLSPDVVHEKPAERKVQVVYGRVRVKLKSAKPVESVPSALDAAAVVETDKSSQDQDKSSQEQLNSSQEKHKSDHEKEKSGPRVDMGSHQKKLDKQEVVTGEVDENDDSSPDIMLSALGNPPKKNGGIKIKSSKVPLVSNCNVVSKSPGLVEQERTPPPMKVEKTESKYDKQELDSSLAVITKVMKMDAAEPFSVPVDPVALGIPDYFDVIDTPMDFGTICNNIRSGSKYKNSEDVFKDVHYIWENCYKYNNKGDYIVDLMKRVKKNFTKYWQAAGLYNDQHQKNGGSDSSHVRDGATSSQGKIHVNTSSSKSKIKKRPGFRRHKDGCLCAVCVLKRRRIEKEGKDLPQCVEDLTGTSDRSMAIDPKQEGASPAESPFGGETSSNPDSQMPESDAEVDGKVEEPERENADQQRISYIQESSQNLEGSQQGDGNEESGRAYSQPQEVVEPANLAVADAQKETPKQHEEDPAIIQLQEAEAKKRRIEVLNESLNNPLLMDLCGTLFPADSKSVWCGPRSIFRKQKRGGSSSVLDTAIESLLK